MIRPGSLGLTTIDKATSSHDKLITIIAFSLYSAIVTTRRAFVIRCTMQIPDKLSIFLFWITILCYTSNVSSGTVLPESIYVYPGEGFLIRLDLPGDVQLQNCQLTRNTKLFLLSPGHSDNHTLPTGEIVKPFDYNNTRECGVRVLNVNAESRGTWKLTAIDEKGLEKSGSMTVNISPNITTCPKSSYGCMIVDWTTKNKTPCSSYDYINSTSGYHCEFVNIGTMSQMVIDHPKDSHDNIRETRTGSSILECKFPHEVMDNCVIQHLATGRTYSIQAGLQHTRYSAYKTNQKAGLCQFEIPQAPNDDEIGFWRLTMEGRGPQEYNYRTGGYDRKTKIKTCTYQVKGNSTLAKERIVQRTKSAVVIKTTNDTVEINCAKNVYYPIHLCYLVDGQQMILSTDGGSDGNCVFRVMPGTWACGFNGPSEDGEDFEQIFEVIKYDRDIIDEALSVDEKGVTTLQCHLIDKSPIRFCMLVSPSGRVYRPPKDTFKSAEFSFYGGGQMVTGDCGIEIGVGLHVEVGIWQCIIVKPNNEKLTVEIYNPGSKDAGTEKEPEPAE